MSRVIPSAWSWYQIVDARWWIGYWKVANPGPHEARNFDAALPSKKLYQVPSVAYPAGMSFAAGRNHASA
ncbi:MAG: hypothetical protein ACXWXQ_00775 [Actinomycetota bacterium]